MSTPEGRVKDAIDREIVKLKQAGELLYTHKPVQNGMGAPTLDYVGCHRSRYFAIEAKAPGKFMTPRQENTKEKIVAAGGIVFEICDQMGIEHFKDWVLRRGIFA